MTDDTVRSQHLAPRWLRAGMSALSALSPEHAARAGAELFATAHARRVRPAEQAWLDRAQRHTVRSRGLDLRVYVWGEGPLVFLHHGWSGNAAQMTALVPLLLERGFGVAALDAAAHGSSQGRRSSLLRMTEDAVVACRTFEPRVFVGHSMGAVVGVRAFRAGIGLERIAMLAPPAEFEPYFEAFARAIGMSSQAHARMMENVSAKSGTRFEELTAEWLTRDPLPPALVVYDETDTDAPPSHARRWIDAWPTTVEVLRTDGLGHRAILRDPAVLERVAEFTRAH